MVYDQPQVTKIQECSLAQKVCNIALSLTCLSSNLTAIMEASPKPSYTTKVGPNDVLLGRGDHSVKNEGNIRFRQLVKAQKARYKNVADVSEKHDIACEIIRAVRDRGGQFLRRVEPLGEAQELGVLSEEEAWVPAEESIVIKKCKQAFRDKPLKKGSIGIDALDHGEGPPRQGSASQQDTIHDMHTSFPQLRQLQQNNRLNEAGIRLDDEIAFHLLANIPRPTQQMDLNEQIARVLGSSHSAASQHQQQLSNILMAEAAIAAELQRRQLADEALTLLTRQPQESSQEQLGRNLIRQLVQSQLPQRQAPLSVPSGNTQSSIAPFLRVQQNPPQSDWLARALSYVPDVGRRSATAVSGSLRSSNTLASSLQTTPSFRLQEAFAQRDGSLSLQEAQRQRQLKGLQALHQLHRLQQQRAAQQQQPSLGTSTLNQASSELEILRALVAQQQQQHEQQLRQTMRPDAEGTTALGASTPNVPLEPLARKRSTSLSPDNKQLRRDESPLSEKEFPSMDDSSPRKRRKTEHKSDSSSLTHD